MCVLRTVLIGLGTVVVLMTGLAHFAQAQDYYDNPFSNSWADSYRDQMDRIEERRQRSYQDEQRIMEQYGFDTPVREGGEYQSWDRLRGLEACNAITNNPAAQSRCLQGLR